MRSMIPSCIYSFINSLYLYHVFIYLFVHLSFVIFTCNYGPISINSTKARFNQNFVGESIHIPSNSKNSTQPSTPLAGQTTETLLHSFSQEFGMIPASWPSDIQATQGCTVFFVENTCETKRNWVEGGSSTKIGNFQGIWKFKGLINKQTSIQLWWFVCQTSSDSKIKLHTPDSMDSSSTKFQPISWHRNPS